jgi:hypothetical protein
LSARISVVVPARNDDYGGNFLSRLQVTVNVLAGHALDAEMIIVEWNPPEDRPPLVEALSWPASLRGRIITVPNEVHRTFEGSEQMPMFEYVAKNVGIRRAEGDQVITMNADILFSKALAARLASEQYFSNSFYRVHRSDVNENCDLINVPVDQIDEACKQNVVRFTRSWEGAEGDFTMMSRDAWMNRINGHPEFLSYDKIDTYTVYLARHRGMQEIIFEEPLYHQEHDRSQRANRPTIGWQIALQEKSNTHAWGLAERQLPRVVMGSKEASCAA